MNNLCPHLKGDKYYLNYNAIYCIQCSRLAINKNEKIITSIVDKNHSLKGLVPFFLLSGNDKANTFVNTMLKFDLLLSKR